MNKHTLIAAAIGLVAGYYLSFWIGASLPTSLQPLAKNS